MAKRTNGLNQKQKLFVDYYIANKFNGRHAAIKAGYSKKTADSQASRLLNNDKVKEYLSKRLKQSLKNTDKLKMQIIQTLKDVAFSDITDVMYWGEDGEVHFKSSVEIDESVRASISEINSRSNYTKEGDYLGTDMRVKQADKLKALDMLARFVQLYEEGKGPTDEASEDNKPSQQERSERLLQLIEKAK